MTWVNPDCDVFLVVETIHGDFPSTHIWGVFTSHYAAYSCMTGHPEWHKRTGSSANDLDYEGGFVEVVGRWLDKIEQPRGEQ